MINYKLIWDPRRFTRTPDPVCGKMEFRVFVDKHIPIR